MLTLFGMLGNADEFFNGVFGKIRLKKDTALFGIRTYEFF